MDEVNFIVIVFMVWSEKRHQGDLATAQRMARADSLRLVSLLEPKVCPVHSGAGHSSCLPPAVVSRNNVTAQADPLFLLPHILRSSQPLLKTTEISWVLGSVSTRMRRKLRESNGKKR